MSSFSVMGPIGNSGQFSRTFRGKPETEITPTGEPGAIPTPLAQPGRPIPYVVGRVRVVRPNAIWYGNLRPIYEITKEVETTEEDVTPVFGGAVKESEEIVTTTYKTVGYNLSMQFSICLGPGVVLKAMGVGEQTIWEGTAGPDRTVISLPTNETILSGNVIFSGGSFDQQPDPFLEEFIDPYALPGYIGVAHVIIEDLRVDQIGSSFPWFEVERFPNPLGLSEEDNRIGDDLNLASALADYVASEWGGAGAGTDAIGTASFTTAAGILADELNAVSFQIEHESTASSIIQAMSHQADGIIYEDPDSGLIEFKLFRKPLINPLTVAKLTETSSSRISRFARNAWPGTKNKLRVMFYNRDKGYEEDSVLGYTFNAINDRFKSDRSASIEFSMCNTSDLAKTLLSRELGKLSTPLSAGEVEATRTGGVGDVLPGDPVQILMADRVQPITGFVTRVRRYGSRENRVVVSFLEYPSQNNNVVFDAETGLGDSLTIGPVAPETVVIKQAPIFLARRAANTSALLASNVIRALVLPTPESHLQASFHAFISNRPGTSGLVGVVRGAPYPTVGELGSAIGQFDEMDDGTFASLTIANVINPIFMRSEGATGVTEGRLLMFIDDEIFSFEGATENLDGSWTLTNVHRALIDTAPQAHAAGAPVFVIGNNYGVVSGGFTYPVTFTPAWRITSNTAFAEGNPEEDYLATTAWDHSFNRIAIPPRPHDTKIDGANRSTSLVNVFGEEGLILEPGQEIDVTWRTRSRNALTVLKQTDAAEEGEVDNLGNVQVHRVMIRDSGGTLHDCGVTADDATYNALTVNVHASAALGRGNLFVRAETIRGNSKYEDQIPVFIMSTDYFVDEEEDFYFVGENGTDLYVME